MNKQTIIDLLLKAKTKKAQLQDICDELKIAYKNENMVLLAEKIAECPEFVGTKHYAELAEMDQPAAQGNSSGDDGLSEDEKLSIQLQEECIEREITLNGDETNEELKALIAKDDADKIDAAEWQNIKENCASLSIELPAEATKEQAWELIEKAKADQKSKDEELAKNEETNRAEARAKQKQKAIDSINAMDVSIEFLNDQADVLIAALAKYKKQMDAQKKASDRFHSAIQTMERMKMNTLVK